MEFLHRAWAEIDLDALKNNLKMLKALAAEAELIAVVKADAYGHGAQELAPVLEKQGADGFAVSNIDEAIALRSAGVKKPILILGYTPAGMAQVLSENDISQCVYSAEYARALSAAAAEKGVTVKIHIKLDTGMSRIGFNCRTDDLAELSTAISAAGLAGFELEGIFTHFAVSDRTPQTEDGFTDCQYKRFKSACDRFKTEGLHPRLCHCCNSAALLQDSDKRLDACRTGIVLYGLTPSADMPFDYGLEPVMTVKSVVSMVKEIHAGDTVNYGRSFKAEKNMKIATVTAGYADGYPRALSNKGSVLIHGRRAKIIGRICMDQFSVDVSDIPEVALGDEVILFGKELPVEELAEICGTINYEIICGISPRVKRVIINK